MFSATTKASNSAFSPINLFSPGIQGAWYDPSDITTLFQDTAGAQPVTAAGQSVGLMLDKSGRGNHATQANLAQRPIYAREPVGGRRNLLTFTEQFDDAVWAKAGTTVTPNAILAPDGTLTADEIRYSGGGANQLNQTITSILSPVTISFWSRRTATAISGLRVGVRNNGVVAVNTFFYSPTEEWQRFSFQFTPSGTGLDQIYFYNGGSSPTNDIPFYLWGAQLELGSTATAYQRVGNNFDVTEAGVPSLSYLSFDGSDDGMATGNIVPGTDKAQVFAGVRKLSDAARGTVAETSGNATDNGAIQIRAPTSAAPNYLWGSSGTSTSTVSASSFAAPISNVVTGFGDISAPSAILRVDGTQVASSTATQGTGNYLTHPLFIGRRAGTSFPFNGRIYGLLVRFGANLTADQITQTERWVAQRTGVTIP